MSSTAISLVEKYASRDPGGPGERIVGNLLCMCLKFAQACSCLLGLFLCQSSFSVDVFVESIAIGVRDLCWIASTQRAGPIRCLAVPAHACVRLLLLSCPTSVDVPCAFVGWMGVSDRDRHQHRGVVHHHRRRSVRDRRGQAQGEELRPRSKGKFQPLPEASDCFSGSVARVNLSCRYTCGGTLYQLNCVVLLSPLGVIHSSFTQSVFSLFQTLSSAMWVKSAQK